LRQRKNFKGKKREIYVNYLDRKFTSLGNPRLKLESDIGWRSLLGRYSICIFSELLQSFKKG
jgi:hypothetical protein